MGPSILREVVENAEAYPIHGLFRFSHYFEEIDAYYHQTAGYEFGVPTGWKALNGLYNVSWPQKYIQFFCYFLTSFLQF